MDKKKPITPKDDQPAQANYSTISKAMPSTQLGKFLKALLVENLSTLEAERIVKTTRIANVATKARQSLGLTLPCVPHPFTNEDGGKGWYGVYSPTPNDKDVIKTALGEAHAK